MLGYVEDGHVQRDRQRLRDNETTFTNISTSYSALLVLIMQHNQRLVMRNPRSVAEQYRAALQEPNAENSEDNSEEN